MTSEFKHCRTCYDHLGWEVNRGLLFLGQKAEKRSRTVYKWK